MSIETTQLQAFVYAARTGSFSAAARKLGKAQSAISTAIANLEIDLDVELFDRSKKMPTLTDAGKTLLREARHILENIQSMENRALALSKNEDALIRLVANDIMPDYSSIDLLREFSLLFPDTNLEISTAAMGDVSIAVEEDMADIGLYASINIPNKRFNYHIIAYIRVVAVASSKHPLAIKKELTDNDLIQHRQLFIKTRNEDEKLENAIYSPRIWLLENVKVITKLVKEGIGWSFIPRHMVEKDLENGRLKKLELVNTEDSDLLIPIYLVWKPESKFGSAAQWLIKRVKEIGTELQKNYS